MEIYKDVAHRYHKAGLKVIPFWNKPDGLVQFPERWAQYRNQTKEDIEKLFSIPSDGIALLCTNGIEVIDIDVKHDPTDQIAKEYQEHLDAYEETSIALNYCVIQKTKSNGLHIIYRTDIEQGNTKLAKRAGHKEAMIETRGKGGLLFIAPTPGYRLMNGDLTDIPIIDDQTRNRFIQCARELDEPEVQKPEIKIEGAKQTPGDITPWDDYNKKTSLYELLDGYGWTMVRQAGKYLRMNRPGAKHSRGIDGSIIDGDIFYPFSTSTVFEAEKGYSAFAVYAAYEHNGDYRAAASDLYKQGFGTRLEIKKQAEAKEKAQEEKKKVLSLLDMARATRFDINTPIVEEESILNLRLTDMTNYSREYKIAGRGMIGAVVGEQKSGKSLVTSCITASGLDRGHYVLNFSLKTPGRIMYFDTEQSAFFYGLTQKRIYDLAGLRTNPDKYEAYLLRRFNVKERVQIIESMLKGQNLDLLIIDGIVDLCENFNDEKASLETMDRLMRWSYETGALLLTVLHVTKGMKYVRGHLGTALQNKADFIIEAKKSGDNEFEVSSRESRFAPFPSFTYSRDEETGMPIIEEQVF